MSYLSAHLAARHEVTLLTWEKPETVPFFPLPASIRLVQADRLGGGKIEWLVRVATRPAVIHREIGRHTPDVVVSFMDTMNVTALLGGLGRRVPVIVSERNDPFLATDPIRATIRNLSYPLAALIVCQTQRMGRYFPASLQAKIRIIANPVPCAAQIAQPARPAANGRFRIITIGRLARQKGHDRLIDAFARVAERQPDWDMVVIGEGPLRTALTDQVRQRGLEERVRFPGAMEDVTAELAASHLLAFPSLYEGFPNALAEGLAAGLPAVGFRGVSGVEELILDGTTGMLVDHGNPVEELAGALSRLMADGPMRARMGASARQHVEQWEPTRVFAQWDKAIAEATAKSS